MQRIQPASREAGQLHGRAERAGRAATRRRGKLRERRDLSKSEQRDTCRSWEPRATLRGGTRSSREGAAGEGSAQWSTEEGEGCAPWMRRSELRQRAWDFYAQS
uniref:Uncharacterized protein n=1 Tax=Zea mays TaxID=4577 RepID=C4J0K2_MAIZE|nr:unknown [Zea mays]